MPAIKAGSEPSKCPAPNAHAMASPTLTARSPMRTSSRRQLRGEVGKPVLERVEVTDECANRVPPVKHLSDHLTSGRIRCIEYEHFTDSTPSLIATEMVCEHIVRYRTKCRASHEMNAQIRKTEEQDFEAILTIINDAAVAYRGVIPADRWHEPYMPENELRQEIARGVEFWATFDGRGLLGVMGIQDKQDVSLVRHAYTTTALQGQGVGTKLLHHVQSLTSKPMLIGTWAAASWAIGFYQKNGFEMVSSAQKNRLLHTYWSIPQRQVETSVVLADREWMNSCSQDE